MGLLDRETVLVTGVANRWSIASGIARRLHAHGANLALTYQGDRVVDALRDYAEEFGDARLSTCHVGNKGPLRRTRNVDAHVQIQNAGRCKPSRVADATTWRRSFVVGDLDRSGLEGAGRWPPAAAHSQPRGAP
jgi:NAD(P)-dependent dehydrogenase (short-subunit alcohol dehydrogenase family)